MFCCRKRVSLLKVVIIKNIFRYEYLLVAYKVYSADSVFYCRPYKNRKNLNRYKAYLNIPIILSDRT